jgi:hypothetical protein
MAMAADWKDTEAESWGQGRETYSFLKPGKWTRGNSSVRPSLAISKIKFLSLISEQDYNISTMYLVSRDTEGDGQLMINKSDKYFEQKEFSDGLGSRFSQEWAHGRTLVIGCNNLHILAQLFSNDRLSSVHLKDTRRVVKEEAIQVAGDSSALKERVNDIESLKDKVYDFIVEFAIFDKASKTTDTLKDNLVDKGHYLYVFSLYEEMSFKRKIVSLLLNRYSVEVELLNYKSIELPVVVINAEKNTQTSANKLLILKIGNISQSIEYSMFLAKLKEAYLATMPDIKGISDLVPGRRIIYDANDPTVDEVIPFYNIKILDNRDTSILSQVV